MTRYAAHASLPRDLRECRKQVIQPPRSQFAAPQAAASKIDPLAATPLLAQSYPERVRATHNGAGA